MIVVMRQNSSPLPGRSSILVLDDPDEGGLGGLEVLTGCGGGQEDLAAAAADPLG